MTEGRSLSGCIAARRQCLAAPRESRLSMGVPQRGFHGSSLLWSQCHSYFHESCGRGLEQVQSRSGAGPETKELLLAHSLPLLPGNSLCLPPGGKAPSA